MLQDFGLTQYRKNLEHVNHIIADIAANNQFITPITSADYPLFEEFFANETRHTYGNSWTYITQSTFGIGPHDFGYKYYDGKNLCTLSIFPKIEQPNIIMLYWIRPLGEEMLSIIAKLAEEIKQKYNVCSYVKKLFPDQYEFLLQHGFRSAKEFPWHSTAHSEDDTYPELIFDREKTIQAILNAPRRSSLGASLRNVSALTRNNHVEIKRKTDGLPNQAWHIVNSFFAEYANFSNKPNMSSPFDHYNIIFNEIDNIEKGILFVNGKSSGFYSLIRDKKNNFIIPYSSIMLRQEYKYLADYFLINLFQNETVKYINFGGSEDKGMYNFKNKYIPNKKNIMHWTTNYH